MSKLGTFERTVGGVPAGVTDKVNYAAVVLLLIGIGSGLFYDPASGVFSGQQGIVTGENLPGAKRHAILTLGDGTEIDLKDEVARMNLSKRQEAPHVGEGALSYRSVTDSVQLSEYHTLQVPRGGEYVLVLADGSEVLLNAESKHLSGSFPGKRRGYIWKERLILK
ncbi:MAG: hypothetical protein ACLU30_15685 [Odoribacter splanchnicus]